MSLVGEAPEVVVFRPQICVRQGFGCRPQICGGDEGLSGCNWPKLMMMMLLDLDELVSKVAMRVAGDDDDIVWAV